MPVLAVLNTLSEWPVALQDGSLVEMWVSLFLLRACSNVSTWGSQWSKLSDIKGI